MMKIQSVTKSVILNLFQDLKRCRVRRSRNKFGMTGKMRGRLYFPVKKKLNILYCTPEVTPFSKTGGLGDVAGSLPKALSATGCDVRIITPKYSGISDSTYKLKKVKDNLTLRIGNREEEGSISEGKLPGSKVPVYFVSSSK